MSTTARLLQIARHVMGCGQASHREELENQPGRDSPLVYDGFTAELSSTRRTEQKRPREAPISSLRVASRSVTASSRFGEELDHLFVECRRDVIGLAARDQASVHNRFLIHPIRTGIFQVGPE